MNANRQRGIDCTPGDLIDITMIVDVLNTADGTVPSTGAVPAVLGTPGDILTLTPPGDGTFELVELQLEGGEEAVTGDLGTEVIYVGDIQSGSTKDGRSVWGGSTGDRNRCAARVLTPDSRLYVNTDPLRVGGLRKFSEKQPLKVGLGITTANNVTGLSVTATVACAEPTKAG
jgi:hypothetical protein